MAKEHELPRGILRYGYTLTCGLCGTVMHHPSGEGPVSFDKLQRSLASSEWRYTRKYGWTCPLEKALQKLSKIRGIPNKKVSRHARTH